MKTKYDLYLAGAMHGRKVRDVLQERQIAKDICDLNGITYYDPAADEGLDKMTPDTVIDLKPDLPLMKGYVEKDDAFVDQCRFLLVLTGDKSSSGTAWEMGRMYYRNQRPIYIVAPSMFMGSLTNFTTVKASGIFPNVGTAIHFIKGELNHAVYNKRTPKINREQSRTCKGTR